jgi:DNA-binding HxlR family transcriptional regulator
MLRDQCPVSNALRVIAGKWKPLILRELKDGSRRFSQLQRRIPEASQKVLTSQLRQLERDGLVERRVFQESILRTEYTLTAYGRDVASGVARTRPVGTGTQPPPKAAGHRPAARTTWRVLPSSPSW